MTIPPSIIIELIHIHGPMKGSIQEFSESSISIGRHPSCSVSFPSKDIISVSRNHAEIIREGNRFKLVDHSTNGTYLNGRKVTEAFLKDGDVLEFSEGGPKVSFFAKTLEIPDARQHSVCTHDDLEVIREEIVLDKPVQVEHFKMERIDESSLPPPQAYQNSPHTSSSSLQQVPISPEVLPSGKVNAPLVIQFGPSLRTYRELPVTIGSAQSCDFVLMHPSILGQHAQIIFAYNQYWIKDLTGQSRIRVNNSPIQFQASLNANDTISLTSDGPVFCYIGEGRFAEATEPDAVTPSEPEIGYGGLQENRGTQSAEPEGLWAKLKKRF